MTQKKIPNVVSDEETIFRNIYSPYHVKKNKVRPTALKPKLTSPDEDDEKKRNNKVSTTRKDYASLAFCKQHALRYAHDRTYAGFLSVKAVDIRKADAEILAKPTEDNPAHANIIFEQVNLSLEEEIDDLVDTRLRYSMTMIVDAGEYIDSSKVEELLDEDAKNYPECGCYEYNDAVDNPTSINCEDVE